MSIPYLPSSQANSGYQQRAAQPPHALAPHSQSMVVLETQSVLMIGQATGGESGLCQHFAKVCTSTHQWMPVSERDMQRLGALNVPSRVLIGMPSGVSPSTGNGPEQKAQCGTSQPTQTPNEGMRTTASRGPAFSNSESQARASQLRARGMGPASYVGAPHEGRRIPGPNMGR